MRISLDTQIYWNFHTFLIIKKMLYNILFYVLLVN